MAPRFFVDDTFEPQTTLTLPEKPAHHASRVLRMREGDRAAIFDGRGHEADVILHFSAIAPTQKFSVCRKAKRKAPFRPRSFSRWSVKKNWIGF